MEGVLSHQVKIDEMSDVAQLVARTSGDTRTSVQASQLASKYAVTQANVKVCISLSNVDVWFSGYSLTL